MELPKKYDPKVSEQKWQKYWAEKKIYKFNLKSDKPVYSIDTPPPYASANHLHVGHAMHYSQFEFVARYKRMRGFNVFFPIGFDDNGLPTERYVEKKHNVNKSKITRKDFIKLCLEETEKTGKTYRDLFNALGFSIDWELLYHTIGDKARKVAQRSFIDLYEKGRMKRIDNPTVWCTRCQTTIAQAEFENVDVTSNFNDIVFKLGGKDLIIATTRPELLPACVALFANPEDARYKDLKGKFAKVPIFDYEVPILFDEAVDLEKGTGLMMVCTFGDKEDIEKWHKHKLPLRIAITEVGRMNDLAGKYSGMKIKEARQAIIEDLKESGELIAQKEIVHPVNVHERCGTDIEFLKKPQWEIQVLDKKEELIEIAQKINWYPEYMKVRYEHWVKNLQWNWGISRQRYYGVPFPVWYCKDCGEVILAPIEKLPVDPREESFEGECVCGSKNIEPEMDVMDTWMTSSVSPQINNDWDKNGLMPFSLRPQGHDIIRTWAFYTIAKSFFHNNDIPWKDIMISGHGQDPHGNKMSKSKGNFVIAQDPICKYSADAFRFWAAGVTLGNDLPYQEKDVLTGHKFVNKMWNASKFGIMHLEDYDGSDKLEFMDKWFMSKLNGVIKKCTEQFDVYGYSKSKSMTEIFFYQTLCDNYLEIVKDRLYNPDVRGVEARKGAQYALYHGILNSIKLMAPIMPHITEEIYQLYFAQKEGLESIHISSWPICDESMIDLEVEKVGDMVIDIVTAVRKYKSDNKISLKTDIEKLTLPEEVKVAEADIKAVTRALNVEYGEGDLDCGSCKISIN